jgi:hypothetical protein
MKESGDKFIFNPRLSAFIRGCNEVLVYRIFTALAARIATTVNEMLAWSMVRIFAQRERIATSVGENAVLVLNARKR